jgi:hypothetical protein
MKERKKERKKERRQKEIRRFKHKNALMAENIEAFPAKTLLHALKEKTKNFAFLFC